MPKLSKTEIESRTKDKSYIALRKNHITNIVDQLPEELQKKVFSKAKTIAPLSKIETAGIIAMYGLGPADKPISKLTVAERRKIIKDQMNKNEELKKFLEENNFMERAETLKEKEVPGDFSPSGLWDVLDELIADLDLSKPE